MENTTTTRHHVQFPITPPQTPESSAYQSPQAEQHINHTAYPSFSSSIPDLDLNSEPGKEDYSENHEYLDADDIKYKWRKGMSESEKDAREDWLSSKKGRKGLRIVIVTENFLPKVDGVTRTLSRLLEHLQTQGHECILLGPASNISTYASHPLVGTLGIPLIIYPGLKLNFLRPKFLSVIREWEPDVVHFVDPIWLGAQTILAMELGWAGDNWISNEGPQIGKGLGGAVVASYHTNLATYATLFGLSFLTPIIWAFQSSLYSKLLLTLCPSPSTKSMLESQSFSSVRLWPRGVDLTQFGPQKRDAALRESWGIKRQNNVKVNTEEKCKIEIKMDNAGLMTPPLTPWNGPIDNNPDCEKGDNRLVLLYVGRISWEKNLQIILSAYSFLKEFLPTGTLFPKLVFVGDGPARLDLEQKCKKEGWDVSFMGHKQGEELAKCYASADIFVFPSFTETFGQVVLEALASGLPVIGLDAEGTRDLVQHGKTGQLLSLPHSNQELSWAQVCKPDSPYFQEISKGYAKLVKNAMVDANLRREMSKCGSTEGIKGYTWWDAMESCVDGYRESMRISRSKRSIDVIPHSPDELSIEIINSPKSRRGLSLVNRVVSRRLAYKEPHIKVQKIRKRWISRKGENGWFTLRTLVKIIMTICLIYAIYRHHHSQMASESFLAAEKLTT
ncbi:uncharacterized protein I206_100026 [Kwoniella pini CBS 10737]|uniref:Glycosyl transferase family 1 domain-containing protein n=1 Tax=Kwoniella pini CBS 10737 TaxID=1296096 RepID=A0AAJ8ML39_9TREE